MASSWSTFCCSCFVFLSGVSLCLCLGPKPPRDKPWQRIWTSDHKDGSTASTKPVVLLAIVYDLQTSPSIHVSDITESSFGNCGPQTSSQSHFFTIPTHLRLPAAWLAGNDVLGSELAGCPHVNLPPPDTHVLKADPNTGGAHCWTLRLQQTRYWFIGGCLWSPRCLAGHELHVQKNTDRYKDLNTQLTLHKVEKKKIKSGFTVDYV